MKKSDMYSCKRGLSHHIEIMISFSIFILFVFFVLLFVQPQDTGYLSDSVLKGLEYNFVNEVSTDVVEFALQFNSDDVAGTYDCFDFMIPNYISNGEFDGALVRFADDTLSNPAIIKYYSSSNDLYVNTGENKSYKVILSSDFTNGTYNHLTCIPPLTAYYGLGSVTRRKVVSLKYLEDVFNQSYASDYDTLKQKLAVPRTYDFKILSPVYTTQKEIPAGVEVISRDYVTEVLFYDDKPGFGRQGDIKVVRFSVQLWR